MPPTVPLDHDCGPKNQQNRTLERKRRDAWGGLPATNDIRRSPIPLFHANVFKATGLLGTL